MLKTLFHSSSKCIHQTVIRNYARKKLANPGIQKQINILEERNESNLEDFDVEELEADFMRLGDVHHQHERELNQYRDKEKYWIVKRKYFKENQCNFLTWNDKEQIRYLHEADPSEWTVEKLSEGFPALPETINKILKNKWHKNESKREQHDKSVESNWKLFKEAKIHVPEDLARHLKKFSSRKPSNHNFNEHRKVVSSNNGQQKPGEFSSIITSYEKIKNINKTDETNADVEPKVLEETSTNNNLYGNKMVPLSYIKKPEVIKIEKEHTPIDLEKIFHGTNKYLTKIDADTTKKPLIVEYPEKISIPKDKYKKGFTYKVNDCYYDDDGLFLYRVPGMY